MDTTIIKTDGRIYVKQGGRYIALIDEEGNFNVKLKSYIQKIDNLQELTTEGFYFYNGSLYSYVNGSLDIVSSDPEALSKLSTIQEGAEVNVQPDWTEQDSLSDAFIQNKPNIPKKTSELVNDSGYLTDVTSISILEIDDLCNF